MPVPNLSRPRRKYCAASALKGRNVPPELEDFIDRHVGPDRQLTLRLALT